MNVVKEFHKIISFHEITSYPEDDQLEGNMRVT
jgi:hypothetical protein